MALFLNSRGLPLQLPYSRVRSGFIYLQQVKEMGLHSPSFASWMGGLAIWLLQLTIWSITC